MDIPGRPTARAQARQLSRTLEQMALQDDLALYRRGIRVRCPYPQLTPDQALLWLADRDEQLALRRQPPAA